VPRQKGTCHGPMTFVAHHCVEAMSRI